MRGKMRDREIRNSTESKSLFTVFLQSRNGMRPPKEEAAWALATVLAFLATLVIAGCATRYNYVYDPTTRFAELKSYAWASAYRDSLVETNVRFIADPLLEQKGFTQATDKPDILIAIVYESEMFGQGYELRMLTLKVYRVSDQILLWQGTASGSISTDAASKDLRKAVQTTLATFPPK
jgi:Domain of unknown function (DUF4136)